MPNNAVLSGPKVVNSAPGVNSTIVAVTLAELNAGKNIIPPFGTNKLRVTGTTLTFNGAFTTATDIRVSTTESTPSDLMVVAIAGATDNARVDETDDTDANVTITTDNYNEALAAGAGIQLRKTGSNAAGGTDIEVQIDWILDSGLNAVEVLN